jgi:hypothetical protein
MINLETFLDPDTGWGRSVVVPPYKAGPSLKVRRSGDS